MRGRSSWSGLGAAALGVCQEGALLSEGRAAAHQGRVAAIKANFAKMWFLAWGLKP